MRTRASGRGESGARAILVLQAFALACSSPIPGGNSPSSPVSEGKQASAPAVVAAPAPGSLSQGVPPPSLPRAAGASLEGGASLPPELVDDGSDDADLEPEPAEEPAPPPAPTPHREERPRIELASIARETWIFAQPRWSGRKLGYLRAGARVERHKKPAGFGGCSEGWYRVEPKGYACIGSTATLDMQDPVALASSRAPVMDDLPYTYVMSRFPPPPVYGRLPSAAEQREAEPGLASLVRTAAHAARDPAYVEPPSADPIPSVLEGGRSAPGLGGAVRPDTAVIAQARTRSGFALLSTFDHDGRRFGLTTDLAVLPIDRTRVIRPSTFVGLRLGDDVTLPVAFVRSRRAVHFTVNAAGGMSRGDPLGWREAVPLTGSKRSVGGISYLEAKDGTWIQADQAVKVERFQNEPAWAAGGRKWIDVSILRQALVAYEGDKPVYVTLVSTGADGIGDPKTTHSTIQGTFLIHTKHVTVTMDGNEDDPDPFDFRDVPFVQYFTEGFALHAAYWHDDFGNPRSHGCVNLSPRDAAWLFQWTGPEVPPGWHAALSIKRGTLVHTHP